MYKSFNISGTTFRPKGDILKAIDLIKSGDVDVTFEFEPDNKADSNAIKVFIEKIFVGYIPKEYNRHVGRIIRGERNYSGIESVIVKATGGTETKPNHGFTVKIIYSRSED